MSFNIGAIHQPGVFGNVPSVLEEEETCLVKFFIDTKISISLGLAPAATTGTADQAFLVVCTEGDWQQICECVIDDPQRYPKSWVESPGTPCCSRVEGTLGGADDDSESGVIVIRHVYCYKYCTPQDGGCLPHELCSGFKGGPLEDREGKTKCCGSPIKISMVAIDMLGANCNCPQSDMVEKLRCINEECFDGDWTRTLTELIDILEDIASDMGGVNTFWRNTCKCFVEMKSVIEAKNPCSNLSCGGKSDPPIMR